MRRAPALLPLKTLLGLLASLGLLIPVAAPASQYPLDQAQQIIDPLAARKLRQAGVRTTADFLVRGRTASDRQALATLAGLPVDRIKSFVLLADLMRVSGIGPDVARLLLAAGVRSIADLRSSVPAQLAARVRDLNHRMHLSTNPPGEPSIRYWVDQAQRLPNVVAPDEQPTRSAAAPARPAPGPTERQRWLLDVMR
jgi:hypothetical protein